MKKIVKLLTFILIALTLLTFTLRLGWGLREKKILNIYILDKTVTSLNRQEHSSFTWLINHSRFTLPNKKSYSLKNDYYGFSPVDPNNESFDFKSIRINELDTYASTFDMAYYADCYGVHSFEWYKGKTKPISSQKVYGGLNQNDYLLLKKMLDNGKLIIAEYNMFSTPTNALVRSKTEELMGISWLGWSGKFFQTFDTNSQHGPPEWMKNLYESQHMGIWPVDKSGIILINNDGLMEILCLDEHLVNALPIISSTSEAVKRFGVAKETKFEQWFEYIKPGDNTVHATFKLNLTDLGKETVAKIGLPEEFPAIIEGEANGRYFYFAGDFADNPVTNWSAKIIGGKWFNYMLNKHNNSYRSEFFKDYYTPLISSILNERYEQVKKTKE